MSLASKNPSIPKPNPVPRPGIIPNKPELNSKPAPKKSPFLKRSIANAVPNTAPRSGIFFKALLPPAFPNALPTIEFLAAVLAPLMNTLSATSEPNALLIPAIASGAFSPISSLLAKSVKTTASSKFLNLTFG